MKFFATLLDLLLSPVGSPWGTRPVPVNVAHNYNYDDSDDDDVPFTINPATGFVMTGGMTGIDSGGNLYGCGSDHDSPSIEIEHASMFSPIDCCPVFEHDVHSLDHCASTSDSSSMFD